MKLLSKHTYFVVFISCIFLISSCENEKKKEMNKGDLNSFAIKYAKAWSSQRPKSVAEFFAPKGRLTVNDGAPAIGTEAITEVAKGFMDAFPDMIVKMDSLVNQSNKKQFHWTLIGTNTGEGGTGNKVKISGFEVWKINKDGLIQESIGSFDSEEYNRQLEKGLIE